MEGTRRSGTQKPSTSNMHPSRVSWLGRRLTIIQRKIRLGLPIPVDAPSKAWVCGRSLAGILGSNSVLVSVVCCQVEVCALGRSLFRRSPTECGVSEREI